MLKILGEDLARVTGNIMKFVNPKSIYLPGEILFDINGSQLRGYSCDDYIAVTDTAELTAGKSDKYFVLSLDDVKDLEKFARTYKKNEIQIIKKSDMIKFDAEQESVWYKIGEYREENWNLIEFILFDDDVEETSLSHFSIRPERLAKLSTLKHDKEAPIDFIAVTSGESTLLRFKLGLTMRGCIMPVKRSEVDAKFLWSGGFDNNDLEE